MRDATCRDCRELTSGDCGAHGPVVYDARCAITMPRCQHGNHPMGCLWCSMAGPQHPIHDRVRELEDTIATLTRERDEARANAERLQSVRDDCVRNEAALIADRDVWRAKAVAAEKAYEAARGVAILAQDRLENVRAACSGDDAELPPLPDGWMRVEALSYGYVILRHHRLTTHILADKYGVEISAQTSENCGITPADLITVLRHAEQAHQQLKEGK